VRAPRESCLCEYNASVNGSKTNGTGDDSGRDRGVGAGSRGSGGYPPAVDRLIAELTGLPGIGRRSAERLAFHLLVRDEGSARRLAESIVAIKRDVRHCSICYNLTEVEPCAICGDPRRRRDVVLVVEQPRDLLALEQTGMYDGVYHVLMGRLSPLEGIGPEELTAARLLDRVDHSADPVRGNAGGEPVREVVLGLNPTTEGDGTGLYLARELGGRGVRVTRLARGLASGSTLEHASPAVLADAIRGRRSME